MKKSLCFFLAAALLGLTACGSNTHAAVSTSSPDAGSSSLHKLTSSNENGLYAPGYSEHGELLCYLDYASGKDFPLCSAPNCTHSNENCSAYISADQCLNDIVIVDENTIAATIYQSGEGSGHRVIYLYDADGQNRRELYHFTSGEEMDSFCCADQDFLYFTKSVADPEGNTYTPGFLCRVPLSGGPAEDLGALNGWVIGIVGRNLVILEEDWSASENRPAPNPPQNATSEELDAFWDAQDQLTEETAGKFVLSLYNLDSKNVTELDHWISQTHGLRGRSLLVKDDCIYWCDQLSFGPMRWIAADGTTGQWSPNWPEELLNIPKPCIYWEDLLNGQPVFTVEDLQTLETHRYTLEPDSGTVRRIPLEYICRGHSTPITLLACTHDRLIAEIESQETLEPNFHPAGSSGPSVTDYNFSVFNRYAFISNEDFLQGTVNYKEFTLDYIQSLLPVYR